MDASITVQRDTEVPLYRQIAERLRERIRRGELKIGDRLPPTRELARDLAVNRVTAQLAYRELSEQGWIRSRVGRGTFVSRGPEAAGRGEGASIEDERANTGAPSGLFAPAAENLFRSANARRLVRSLHADTIDFSGRIPDERLFKVEEFRAAVERALTRHGSELLQYGPPAGDEELRAWIAARLRTRGVEARTEDVLLVNGAQQGLTLAAQAFAPAGSTVLCESPTYHQAMEIFTGLSLAVAATPMGPHGVLADELARSLQTNNPRFFYTMPDFQNPTGTTQDRATRAALVEAAASARVPVIEDDFEHDLRIRGDELAPLAAEPGGAAIVLIGTFSKGLFPGLRVGWIHAREDVLSRLFEMKRTFDLSGSWLLQASLREFILEGGYDRHLVVLKELLERKHQAAREALEKHLSDQARWTVPDGGYGLWIELEGAFDAARLERVAADEGVLFTPGHLFSNGPTTGTAMRLSLSRVAIEEIEPGLERLARAVERARDESPPSRDPRRMPLV